MSVYYLDTSVAVSALLGHSPSAAAWFDATTARSEDSILSSRIARTELTRALRREGLPIVLRDQVLDYLELVPLTDGVLAEAEAITPHVKTLDAIHLASAISTGLDPIIVTHDQTMRAAADLLGCATLDPIIEG